MADATRAPTVEVIVQRLDPTHLSIAYDNMINGRRVVSLVIGGGDATVKLLDDLETVAAVIHRADVILQARLQMPLAETAVAP